MLNDDVIVCRCEAVGYQSCRGSPPEHHLGLRGSEDWAGEQSQRRGCRHPCQGSGPGPGSQHTGGCHWETGRPPLACVGLEEAICCNSVHQLLYYKFATIISIVPANISPSPVEWRQGSLTGSGWAIRGGLLSASQDYQHTHLAWEDWWCQLNGLTGMLCVCGCIVFKSVGYKW